MKKKSLENHSRLAVAFHLPAFFVLSVITLGPLLYTLKISFFDYKLSSSGSEDVFVGLQNYINTVSYTHLDVYKRQLYRRAFDRRD